MCTKASVIAASYEEALVEAIRLGVAEPDNTDVVETNQTEYV